MDLKELYFFAYKFLLSTDGITSFDIEKHINPIINKQEDLNSIYLSLCISAQNRQMSDKVIGNSIGGVENLKSVLFNFNPYLVSKNYNNQQHLELLNSIINKIAPKGKIRMSPKSIWPNYCKTIIYSAHFSFKISFCKRIL